MTTGTGIETGVPKPPVRRRNNTCCCCAIVTASLLLILLAIALILYFTVFKIKDPTTTIFSASVSGVSPRVTIPTIRIELNISLDLSILVYNPNRAAFSHGTGKSYVVYRGVQVGEADLEPGRIPPRGSESIKCRLTVEADRFASDLGQLLSDVMAGEVGVDTTTRIPGRVSILGIFKKHAVALVNCHVAIGFPELKIRRQECKHQTKL